MGDVKLTSEKKHGLKKNGSGSFTPTAARTNLKIERQSDLDLLFHFDGRKV